MPNPPKVIFKKDLQDGYDNDPEIVTTTALGAVSLKRGSAADTDDVLEVLDGSDVQVMHITGDTSFFKKIIDLTATQKVGVNPVFNMDATSAASSTGRMYTQLVAATNVSTGSLLVVGQGIEATHDAGASVGLVCYFPQLLYGANSTVAPTINSGIFCVSPGFDGASLATPNTLTGINIQNQGDSAISNSYAIRIEAQTGSTLSYGLGVDGINVLNYLRGYVVVGKKTTTHAEHFVSEKDARFVADTTFMAEVLGSRDSRHFGHNPAFTADTYLSMVNGTPSSATKGYPMIRAGSVVGFGVDLEITVETTPGTIDFDVRINNVSAFIVTVTTTGTGDYIQSFTQLRDVDTFVADDRLQVFCNLNTFVGTVDNVQSTVEIMVDS